MNQSVQTEAVFQWLPQVEKAWSAVDGFIPSLIGAGYDRPLMTFSLAVADPENVEKRAALCRLLIGLERILSDELIRLREAGPDIVLGDVLSEEDCLVVNRWAGLSRNLRLVQGAKSELGGLDQIQPSGATEVEQRLCDVYKMNGR